MANRLCRRRLMMKNKSFKEKFMTVWDIMFVLVLCFVIILTTMLLSGTAEVGDYRIDPRMLGGVVLALVIYLAYMLKRSIRMLDEIRREQMKEDSAEEPCHE